MFTFGWISLSLCLFLAFSFRLVIVGCLELKYVGLLLEAVDLRLEMFGFVESWWI